MMPIEEKPPVTLPDTTIRYYSTPVKDLVQRYESADVPDLHALLADSLEKCSNTFLYSTIRARITADTGKINPFGTNFFSAASDRFLPANFSSFFVFRIRNF